MKIVKRLSFSLLSAILAVLMSLLTPVQCIGAENKIVYVSDIKFAYGDSGISDLESAGYTVWKDLNANEGGNGDSVWIGYKTTTDIKDAITDVAMMNMNGGYSFTEWEKEFKRLNENVNNMQNDIISAINEFRQNYKSGSEFAKVAYRFLNLYVEEDSKVALGDLFIDDALSESDVHKILLEGNTESLDVVERSLAVGLVDCDDENIITRLAQSEYPDELDVGYNHERTLLFNAIASFRQTLIDAETVEQKANAYKGGADAYIESLDDSEKASTIYQIELVKIAKQVRFGDLITKDADGEEKRLSLYDVAMLETEESEEGEEEENTALILNMNMVEMLRLSVTEGQTGVISAVGIDTVLLNAYAAAGKDGFATTGITYDENGNAVFQYKEVTGEHTVLDTLKEELTELEQLEKVSVYYGVDREAFSNSKEVAMTSSAIRERALSGDTSLGRGNIEINSEADSKRVMAFSIVSGASAAIGIGCFIGAYKITYGKNIPIDPIPNLNYRVQISKVGTGEVTKMVDVTSKINSGETCYSICKEYEKVYGEGYKVNIASNPKSALESDNSFATYAENSVNTNMNTALMVAGFIAVALMVISIAATLIEMFVKPIIGKYSYTEIPRILVDVIENKNGKKIYTYYRAVSLVKNIRDGSKTIYRYGDVNAINDTDQWYVMYYTKNLNVGYPITPDILVKNDSSLTMSEQNEYKAVHDFGSTAAADMNHYNSKQSAGSIYIFFKTAESSLTNPDSGSLFNLENGIICLSSVIVGGLAAFVVTYLVMKKKKNTVAQ